MNSEPTPKNASQTAANSAQGSQVQPEPVPSPATTSSGTTTPKTVTDDIDYELEALRAELYEGGPLPDANYFDHDPFCYDGPDD